MDSVECSQCICKDAVAHVIMPTSKTDDNSFHLSFLLLQTLDRTARKIPVDKENSAPLPHTGDNQSQQVFRMMLSGQRAVLTQRRMIPPQIRTGR